MEAMQRRDEILQLLRDETMNRRRQNRGMQIVLGVFLVLALVAMGLHWKTTGELDPTIFASMITIFAGGMTIGITPRMKDALVEVASDPAAIPFLVEAMDSADTTVVPLARQMLIQGLPKLTPDDAAQFDAPARAALAKALMTTQDADFAIAALSGLRSIGMATELTVMDQAAKQQLVNLPKPHRERVGQLALTASADVRLRLAKSLVDSRVGAANEQFDAAAAKLPVEEVRLEA
jgi:hypothetical protein